MHRQTGRAAPTFASTWTQHTKKGKFWTKRPEWANFGLSDQNRKNLEIVLQQKLSCNRGLYLTVKDNSVNPFYWRKRQLKKCYFVQPNKEDTMTLTWLEKLQITIPLYQFFRIRANICARILFLGIDCLSIPLIFVFCFLFGIECMSPPLLFVYVNKSPCWVTRQILCRSVA